MFGIYPKLIFYNVYAKRFDVKSLDVYCEEHLQKFGRLTLGVTGPKSYGFKNQIVKRQNTLIVYGDLKLVEQIMDILELCPKKYIHEINNIKIDYPEMFI